MKTATELAQKIADQKLEACCEWLFSNRWDQAANELHAARHPKSLSLKEQSLDLIDLIQSSTKAWNIRDLDVVRRALQQLPD